MTQKGFTLIELVVVIVILGILAATALPKFVDLKGDAAKAAVDGAAGALNSASALNYAKAQIPNAVAGTDFVALTANNACNSLATTAIAGVGLIGNALPAGITITADGDCTAPTAGQTVNCTLSNSATTPAKTATVLLICTG